MYFASASLGRDQSPRVKQRYIQYGVLIPLSSVLRHLLGSVTYVIKWIPVRGNRKITVSTPLPFYVRTQEKIHAYFHSNTSKATGAYHNRKTK